MGTTDTAIEEASLEPRPFDDEVEFVLETASRYLRRPLTRADVRSVFVGIRPLVRSADAKSTAALSRDHVIHIDPTGLVTLTGGKWTTWRSMAEHCVNTAAMLEHLPEKPCPTRHLNIHGFHRQAERFGPLAVYGSDALHIQDLVRAEPALGERLHPALPTCGSEVVWAARSEMARTVDDVLARRARALFLNARAAIEMAPRAAELLARELGRDEAWREAQVRAFRELAAGYLVS